MNDFGSNLITRAQVFSKVIQFARNFVWALNISKNLKNNKLPGTLKH